MFNFKEKVRKMREKLIVVLMVIALVLLFTSSGFAHSYYRGKSDNPIRYVAYVVYPVGMACEYLVTRPIHWLVSRPNLCKVFGHKPKEDDVYFVWE